MPFLQKGSREFESLSPYFEDRALNGYFELGLLTIAQNGSYGGKKFREVAFPGYQRQPLVMMLMETELGPVVSNPHGMRFPRAETEYTVDAMGIFRPSGEFWFVIEMATPRTVPNTNFAEIAPGQIFIVVRQFKNPLFSIVG